MIELDLISKPPPSAFIAATFFLSQGSNNPSIDLVYPQLADSTDLLINYWSSETNWTTGTAPVLPSNIDEGSGFGINSLQRIYVVVDGVLKEFGPSGKEISVVPTDN